MNDRWLPAMVVQIQVTQRLAHQRQLIAGIVNNEVLVPARHRRDLTAQNTGADGVEGANRQRLALARGENASLRAP